MTAYHFVSIYGIIVLVAVLTFILVSKFLKLDYDVRMHHAKSMSSPIIRAIIVLMTIYTGRNFFATPIVNLGIEFWNSYSNRHVTPIQNDQTMIGLIEAIVLYVIIGGITVVYIFYAYNKSRVEQILAPLTTEKKSAAIILPVDAYNSSPIFHERIREIFQLKFEKNNLELKYDSNEKILYGTYTEAFNKFLKIVVCHESVLPIRVSKESIISRMSDVKRLIFAQQKGDEIANIITDYYYILENGYIESANEHKIECYTEYSLINNLIDFRRYLEKLLEKFEKQKLPFTQSDSSNGNFSIKDTFLEPNFLVSKKKCSIALTNYVDSWLINNDRRQLAILGDYGMGKSTFLKFYAARLAKQKLEGIANDKRFPVFISLTNTSPRHSGIGNNIAKFIADNLGVSTELFNVLIREGRVVFLLDGFDEMGYIGTHDQRIKQFNAIWQLATNKNKIILTGRPSYFPSDTDLIEALNIKDSEEEYIPQEYPYFERIELEGFEKEQIELSLRAYNYQDSDLEKYKEFIFSNTNLLDLCKRPSMMHIIREMLPKIFAEHTAKKLNPSILMKKYMDHWIERQVEKDITSAVENKNQKKEIVWEIFSELAADFFAKKLEKESKNDVLETVNLKNARLGLTDTSEVEGWQTEILSAYFIEIDNDYYRFVHKSFKEFLVSYRISQLIKEDNIRHPLIVSHRWSKEIVDFVYDYLEVADVTTSDSKFPYLLNLYEKSRYIKSATKYTMETIYTMSLGITGISFPKFLFRIITTPQGLTSFALFFALMVVDFVFKRKGKKSSFIMDVAWNGYYYAWLRNPEIVNKNVPYTTKYFELRQTGFDPAVFEVDV